MNDQPPPPLIEPPASPPPNYPSPWKAAGIGVLIFIASCLFCVANPFFLLVGFIGAVVPLFIKGYRCIFVGYILCVGLTLLALVIACSIDPPNFH